LKGSEGSAQDTSFWGRFGVGQIDGGGVWNFECQWKSATAIFYKMMKLTDPSRPSLFFALFALFQVAA
jgi:hypothetical protein